MSLLDVAAPSPMDFFGMFSPMEKILIVIGILVLIALIIVIVKLVKRNKKK